MKSNKSKKSKNSSKSKKSKKGKILYIKKKKKDEEKDTENEDKNHKRKGRKEMVKFEDDEDEESYINNRKINNQKRVNRSNFKNNNKNNNLKKQNNNDEKQGMVIKNLAVRKGKGKAKYIYGKGKNNLKGFNNKFIQNMNENDEEEIEISNSFYSQQYENSNEYENFNDNKYNTSDDELILNEKDKERLGNKSNLINNNLNSDNEDYNQPTIMVKKRFVKNVDYSKFIIKTYVIKNFKSKDKKTNKDIYIPCKQISFILSKNSNDGNNTEYFDMKKVDEKLNQLYKKEQNKTMSESYYLNLTSGRSKKDYFDYYDINYSNGHKKTSFKHYNSNDLDEIKNKKRNWGSVICKKDFDMNLGGKKNIKRNSEMSRTIRMRKNKKNEDALEFRMKKKYNKPDVLFRDINLLKHLSNNKKNSYNENENNEKVNDNNKNNDENDKSNEINENIKKNENSENIENIENIENESKNDKEDIDDIVICENGTRYLLFKYANNFRKYYKENSFIYEICHEANIQLKPINNNNYEKNETEYEKSYNKKKKKKDNKVCFPLDKKVYADKIYKNTLSNDRFVKTVVKTNQLKRKSKKESIKENEENEENKKIDLELQKQKIREMQKQREIEKEREKALERQRKKEREDTIRQEELEKLKSTQKLIKIYNEKYLDYEDKKKDDDIKNKTIVIKNNYYPSNYDSNDQFDTNIINNYSKSRTNIFSNMSLNIKRKKRYFSCESKEPSRIIRKVKGHKAKIRKFITKNIEKSYKKFPTNKSMKNLHVGVKKVKIIKFVDLENDTSYNNLNPKKSKSNINFGFKNNRSMENMKVNHLKNDTFSDQKEKIIQKKLYYQTHVSKSTYDTFSQNNNYNNSNKKVLIVNKKTDNESNKNKNKKHMNKSSSGPLIIVNLNKKLTKTNKNLNEEIKFYNGPIDIGCISTKNYNASIEYLNNKLGNFGYRCIKHINHSLTYTNDYKIIYVEIVKIKNNLFYYLTNKKRIVLYKNRRISKC